jgi:uncharacterized caspase-like protein
MTTRDLRPEVVGTWPAIGQPADRFHTYAVVVGIDRYPGYGDLQGACNDAQAFRDWLVDPGGGDVPEDNVRLHLSGRARSVGGARPLKQEIDRDLEELVGHAERDPLSSRLYLYFAGHGIVPTQSTGAGVLANAVPRACWNLSFSTYLTWFERCKALAEVVMLSDCCRGLTEAEAGAPLHDTCRGVQRRGQSTLVAHATDVGATALEAPSAGGPVRGFFTSALVDGLRGGAADPQTGEVDANSLAAFLHREVLARSGGRQYPAITPSYPPLLLGRPV